MITRAQFRLILVAIVAMPVALVAFVTGLVRLGVASLSIGFGAAFSMLVIAICRTREPGAPWRWRSLCNLRDPLVLMADLFAVTAVLLLPLYDSVLDAGAVAWLLTALTAVTAAGIVLLAVAAGSRRAAVDTEDGQAQKS